MLMFDGNMNYYSHKLVGMIYISQTTLLLLNALGIEALTIRNGCWGGFIV